MKSKTVCFIGHRKISLDETGEERLKDIIEGLIVKENVRVFLFGSRSEFDDICHEIVTDLKAKYPFIERYVYTCSSEGCVLESEREEREKIYSSVLNREVHLLGVEKEVEFKNKWVAGQASYVERNRAMIDDSTICVFYYDENYVVKERKRSKRDLTFYVPKSGTGLAYSYAKQKKKQIINIFDLLR